MSASAAAKQLGIHHKKTGRSRILRDEHKQVTLEYIDENPSVVLEQVMERLLQKFQDLKASKSTVYNLPAMAAPDRYRLWNRDVAACLNYMHILRGLRHVEEEWTIRSNQELEYV
ncbi:hypothetical protein G6F69_009530 [Rhizopus microsporus]|nr:hypothetical protein G6F69_009530 [Rhizopus microsporus]